MRWASKGKIYKWPAFEDMSICIDSLHCYQVEQEPTFYPRLHLCPYFVGVSSKKV